MRTPGKPLNMLPLQTRRHQCVRDIRLIRREFKEQMRSLWEDLHAMGASFGDKEITSIPASFLSPKTVKPLPVASLKAIQARVHNFTAREAVGVLLFSRVDFYLKLTVKKVRQFFPVSGRAHVPPCATCGRPGPKWDPKRPSFGRDFFLLDQGQVGLANWDKPPLSDLLDRFRQIRKERDAFAHHKGRIRLAAGSPGKLVWSDAKVADAFCACEELFVAASRQIQKAASKHA